MELANAITQQENSLKYAMEMPVSTSITIPEIELSTVTAVAQLQDSININNRTEYKLMQTQQNLLGLQKKACKAEY